MKKKIEKLTVELEKGGMALVLDSYSKKRLKKNIKDWNFKDPSSLLQFVFSVLEHSRDKQTIGFMEDGNIKRVQPASHLLKEGRI